MRLRFASLSLLLGSLFTTPAGAALTDSEKAVVRGLVRQGALDSVGRVRSLVARPDLSPAEIAEPLRPAFAEAPFDDAHRRFAETLLFGPGSSAARNALVPAVVESLLERAAARMGEVPIDPGRRIDKRAVAAADEVVAIHAFVDSKIANAGNPPADGHDPTVAIRDDALRASVALYKTHLGSHERWFKAPGKVTAELVRARTQAEVALIDLARGIHGRYEVSPWLGLTGARRAVFERRGVLVEADDTTDEKTLAPLIGMLDGFPRATEGLSVWMVSSANEASIVARGRVVRVNAPLGDSAYRLAPDVLWPEDVKPSSPDAGTAAALESVAELATERALASDAALREWAARAAEHTARGGVAGLLSVDVARIAATPKVTNPLADPARIVARAVRLLSVDAPRTVDLALVRAGEGHPEALEQLAVALAVTAAGRSKVTLGRTRDDGSIESVDLTEVTVEKGVVTRFTLGGHKLALVPDADGGFSATIDGKAPKLTALASFAERTRPGEAWTIEGSDYRRLTGEPRAAGLDDGRMLVDGGKGSFDAIATGASVGDVEVSAIIKATGAGGGLLVRGNAGDAGYTGIGLLLQVDPAEGRLLWFDGRGKASELSPPTQLPAATADGYVVSLAVVDDQVTAKIGDKTVTATLGREVPPGAVGLVVRARSRLEVRRFKSGDPKPVIVRAKAKAKAHP